MKGFGIVLIPFSWALGPLDLGHKALFAIGPIRFVYYRALKRSYR